MKLPYKILILGTAASLVGTADLRPVGARCFEALNTPAVINPQSFETDTKAMLEDWYLKNYTVLDYDADSKPQEQVSDEVLIERLSKLPSIIEMPLNGPVRNMINFYANRKRQLVENMLGLSLYYMPIFEEALERHGMPNELRYLPVIESALVPTAVSRAGAADCGSSCRRQRPATASKSTASLTSAATRTWHLTPPQDISSSSTTPTTTGRLPSRRITAALAM